MNRRDSIRHIRIQTNQMPKPPLQGDTIELLITLLAKLLLPMETAAKVFSGYKMCQSSGIV